MTIKFKHSTGFLAVMLLITACKKDKYNFDYDNRLVTDVQKKSNVRLINLAAFNQVIANGDTLTNFVSRGPGDPNGGKYPGTLYFPANGRLGKIWEIPLRVLDQRESAAMTLVNKNNDGALENTIQLSVTNSYSKPTDYFLLPVRFFKGQPEVVPVPRDLTAASKPDHFKIRIINLTGSINTQITSVTGPQENLEQALTLTYADGTPVSPQTSNIDKANPVSAYVEVPYGTYQFKVLTADGRAVPALSQDPNFNIIEPSNSSLANRYNEFINLVYAPLRIYQPGGIYTVIVTAQKFNYKMNELDQESLMYQNSFQVIGDNNPAPNTTYCRLQGVNALSSSGISIQANGQEVAANLGFGKAGIYSNLIAGHCRLTATDAAGKVIATTEQVLRASQNYTAWLYPATDGSTQLLIVANDLSGVQYTGSSDDGTYDYIQYDYTLNRRFLNFSPDNPYITFTKGNGQRDNIDQAVNLEPGIPKTRLPYIITHRSQQQFDIMAFRSTPDIIPGVWAYDIPIRSSQDFIANKHLYTNAGKTLPAFEPGIFTVALIGRTGNAFPKATMTIIKHNK